MRCMWCCIYVVRAHTQRVQRVGSALTAGAAPSQLRVEVLNQARLASYQTLQHFIELYDDIHTKQTALMVRTVGSSTTTASHGGFTVLIAEQTRQFQSCRLKHLTVHTPPLAKGADGEVSRVTVKVMDDTPFSDDIQGHDFALKMLFDWGASCVAL